MIIGRRAPMVEKYMRGGMSPKEKQAFLKRLDNDAGLRRILAEEQSLEAALLRDKGRVPVLSTDFPERLYRKLAQYPAPNGGDLDRTDGPPNDGSPRHGGGMGAELFMLFASLLIVMGAAFTPFALRSPSTPPPSRGQHSNVPGVTESAGRQRHTSDGQQHMSSTADTAVFESQGSALLDSSHISGRSEGGASLRPSLRNQPKEGSHGQDEAVRDYLDREERTGGVSVIKSDKTRLKVEVKEDKK